MATKGTVLVTGVNGYISAQVAAFYLEAGFSVRGTVRAKNASTNDILEALQEFVSDGRFDVVEVPDITVDGAFDEAVKGTSPSHPPRRLLVSPSMSHPTDHQSKRPLQASPSSRIWRVPCPAPSPIPSQ